ncbi:MAG: HAMP domain-containing sensor histidine kinase [Kiritimatiellae bacterium]|nr:HAMP domain-containing sensor histidine kinase [Kiritimatiellia bacterium]
MKNRAGSAKERKQARQPKEPPETDIPSPSSTEELLRKKDAFLANISHELRTPMHGILSFSRFGMQNVQSAPREKLARYFEQINTSANRLMDLLNDLLDLSKNAGGKHLYHFQSHDLIDLINAVVLEFNASIREKQLSLYLERPAFPVTLECDGPKIRQVISNLLTNAIKYSYPGGSILYTFHRHPDPDNPNDECLALKIADEGIGIPHGELETIFDKFAQSSYSQTGAGGTGLGLAISREIIHAHRGHVRAEHNPAGGGAVFCVTLPIHQKEANHAPTAARG